MSLKHYVFRFLLGCGALLLVVPTVAKADVLVERDSTIFGRIKTISNSTVSIARGCNNNDLQNVPKDRVRFYQFDSACQPHQFTLPTSPLQVCPEPKQQMMKVFFRGQVQEVLATQVLLGDGNLVCLILPNNGGSLQGPRSKIRSIVPANVCPSSIPSSFTWPKEYCHEPFKMAVNFELKPVYNNQIFTRGFTFYLEVVGPDSHESSEEYARAFGAALNLWASKLLALRPTLPPRLVSFVDSAISRSKSFVLFVPPQVIQVDCPENAVMIVKLYKARPRQLFPVRSGYVAKAQLEGRTILLNAVDFKFRTDLDTRSFLKDDRLNLTTVFAHELGHCFGLADDTQHSQSSIMNTDDVTNGVVGGPTDADGLDFVRVLEQVVSGSRPGEFNPTECAGLRFASYLQHND